MVQEWHEMSLSDGETGRESPAEDDDDKDDGDGDGDEEDHEAEADEDGGEGRRYGARRDKAKEGGTAAAAETGVGGYGGEGPDMGLEFENARIVRRGKPVLFNFRDIGFATFHDSRGGVRLRPGVIYRSACWSRAPVSRQDVVAVLKFWQEACDIRTLLDLRSKAEKLNLAAEERAAEEEAEDEERGEEELWHLTLADW
ncbi:uncharacterized protein ACA1_060280 [Acanthamoeba castellanii str. Neff]|uniref:Uncharacterized protein n=1 Tax=Acanthamoeba castellanii (strain ATCC 30010 / Neff) TaxID=1257118 RepID=L8GYV8_ACACF|nr:uncharacterized protein ACA1_060280 [Acanthamoeba castellanii str. Neff]ELR17301.1 hypothetical protein ACA1_060280 [Acanthamoeba castellanii str. Neff]